MLAFIISPFGRFLDILLVIVLIAGFAYFEHLTITDLRGKIVTLNEEAAALQTWNTNLEKSIENVQKLQQSTNQSLITIQTQAAQTALELQQRQFTGSSSEIEKQVNLDFAAQLARLKALSNAQ